LAYFNCLLSPCFSLCAFFSAACAWSSSLFLLFASAFASVLAFNSFCFFSCAFLLFSASTFAFEQQNMVKINRRENVKEAYRHDVVLLACSSVNPADLFVFLPSSLWRLMCNCQLDSIRSRKREGHTLTINFFILRSRVG
jgi:hypothetical protein